MGEKEARGQRLRLLKIIDGISEWSGHILSYFIYFVIFFLIYEIVLRYFFDLPTPWVHETSKLIFGAASVLMGAYCLLHHQHIRIDVIYGRFSMRSKAVVDCFTLLLIMFFCTLQIIHGIPFAKQAFVLQEVPIMAFKPLLWTEKACIPLAGSMVVLQAIAQWVRSFHFAVTGKELA
jgi:TRAP-type mannitol/chloroaromatic compound transport system permease small subunit